MSIVVGVFVGVSYRYSGDSVGGVVSPVTQR